MFWIVFNRKFSHVQPSMFNLLPRTILTLTSYKNTIIDITFYPYSITFFVPILCRLERLSEVFLRGLGEFSSFFVFQFKLKSFLLNFFVKIPNLLTRIFLKSFLSSFLFLENSSKPLKIPPTIPLLS